MFRLHLVDQFCDFREKDDDPDAIESAPEVDTDTELIEDMGTLNDDRILCHATKKMAETQGQLARELRQRLESLRRAGLTQLPRSVVTNPTRSKSVALERRSEPELAETNPSPVAEALLPALQTAIPLKPAPVIPSLFEEPPIDRPMVPADERVARLEILAKEVAACVRCPLLASTRTQTVFGSGSPTARLMFVGEAPGEEEDLSGQPFVGRSGQLLTDMITKGMGLTREEVYIANVVKSRPPLNRVPFADEIKHCLPFLETQIAIIRPEFICMLGKVAASSLLDTSLAVGRLRGKWHRYRGIASIVTYHPSYLLREPSAKKAAWEDLQMLMLAMGLRVPSRKKS